MLPLLLYNPSRGIRTISFFDSNEIRLKKIDNPTLIIENLWCVSWESWKFWNGFMKSNWFILDFFNGLLCFCYQKIRTVSFILRRICMCVHGARDKDMFWFWNQNTGIVVDFWSFKWRKLQHCLRMEDFKIENLRLKNIYFLGHTLKIWKSRLWNGKSIVRTLCTMNFRSVREFFNTNLDGLMPT